MQVTINGTEYIPMPFRPKVNVPPRTLFLQARKRRKATLREVSEGTGLSISTIFKAESGSSITMLTAIKLCRFYQIDMDVLAESVMRNKL